jgi:molybdopterin converting factor small subunit
MATVILPRSLVALIAGVERTTEVEATTVAQVIDRLDERTPGIRNRLVDTGPAVRTHINVFVDGALADLDTPIRPDSTIHIIPAVSGG